MYSYHSNYHDPYAHKPKTNDIFEQTVIVDSPISKSFYDCLREVTIDTQIVIGRKGIVEEIVPLEQWASVISDTFEAIKEEEEWIIEPEETIYTVVKWEGVEGGEKHIVENRQWKEVAHTPPIHTKQHVSPLLEFDATQNDSLFSFGNDDHFVHIADAKSDHISESHNKSDVKIQNPHVSETVETTWHSSRQESTTFTSNYTNRHASTSPNTNEDSKGPWHKIERSVETGEIAQNQSNQSPKPRNFRHEEHHTTWHKSHVNIPEHHHVKNAEMPQSPQSPKSQSSTYSSSYVSKFSTPERYASPLGNGTTAQTPQKSPIGNGTSQSSGQLSSPLGNGTTRTPSPKPFPRANTLSSSSPAPLPSPPTEKHIYIAAKPASHFVTSYTVKNSTTSTEQAHSPSNTTGVQQKVTWRRTHGNQYVRETVPVNQTK